MADLSWIDTMVRESLDKAAPELEKMVYGSHADTIDAIADALKDLPDDFTPLMTASFLREVANDWRAKHGIERK